jgi:hypothetical protein
MITRVSLVMRTGRGRRPADRLPCVTDIWDLPRSATGSDWWPGAKPLTSDLARRPVLRYGGSNRFLRGSIRVPRRHAIKSLPPPRMADDVPAGQDHRALVRGTLMLEIDLGPVAYGAMWGYGVDPPSAWNPSI